MQLDLDLEQDVIRMLIFLMKLYRSIPWGSRDAVQLLELCPEAAVDWMGANKRRLNPDKWGGWLPCPSLMCTSCSGQGCRNRFIVWEYFYVVKQPAIFGCRAAYTFN